MSLFILQSNIGTLKADTTTQNYFTSPRLSTDKAKRSFQRWQLRSENVTTLVITLESSCSHRHA